jgi:hypothetical protein
MANVSDSIQEKQRIYPWIIQMMAINQGVSLERAGQGWENGRMVNHPDWQGRKLLLLLGLKGQ